MPPATLIAERLYQPPLPAHTMHSNSGPLAPALGGHFQSIKSLGRSAPQHNSAHTTRRVWCPALPCPAQPFQLVKRWHLVLRTIVYCTPYLLCRRVLSRSGIGPGSAGATSHGVVTESFALSPVPLGSLSRRTKQIALPAEPFIDVQLLFRSSTALTPGLCTTRHIAAVVGLWLAKQKLNTYRHNLHQCPSSLGPAYFSYIGLPSDNSHSDDASAKRGQCTSRKGRRKTHATVLLRPVTWQQA